MTSRWDQDGPRYGLDWGGRRWWLAVDGPRPGLVADDPQAGPILALDGLTAPGRSDFDAFGGASLVEHRLHFDRVEATYIPAGWGSLKVRAAWSARSEGDVDLEVQVQAYTVDELKAIEVHVSSRPGPSETSPTYIELIHPDDVSHAAGPHVRDHDGPGSVRHALFGYDLEKGIILRGRLRGTWLLGPPDEAEIDRRRRAFLREPLPLGT